MATAIQIKRAKQCMTAIADGLNAMNLRYDRQDADFCLEFRARTAGGHQLDLMVRVHPGSEVVEYYFITDIHIPEKKYMDFALATCYVNNILVIGGFECSVDDDTVCYKISTDYCESYPGRDLVSRAIECGANMVDQFGDYFNKLGQGTMTLKQFYAVVKAA